MKLEFSEEGDKVLSFWEPTPEYQGFTGVLHGGIQATLLDEIGGWAIMVKLGTAGVTSKMEVKYRRPVRVDEGPIRLEAVVSSNAGRLATLQCSVHNAADQLCTEAIIEYYLFNEERARKELYYPGKMAFFSNSE
ncbi:MAG: PaaI family thioesterase [Bacteroidales bacterium]